jgi:hypothetical protein
VQIAFSFAEALLVEGKQLEASNLSSLVADGYSGPSPGGFEDRRAGKINERPGTTL